MKILSDRHHADLLHGLQRLFEDRLGSELYVTIGRGWYDANIWRFGEVWGDDRLARQFLDLNDSWREVEPGLFLTFDPCHPERPLYGITLERAWTMQWDYVLATVQDNQRGFHSFAQSIGARYLYHVGNARQEVDWTLAPLVLDATGVLNGRAVSVSEDFDHLTTFRYRVPESTDRVTSFVNLLSKIPESYAPFTELRGLLPEYEFRSFGHECPDGFLTPVAAVAEEMARAAWAYHDKPTGDGFGHIIHGWAAVGRPLIGHASYYRGQRAEIFWRDGETCVDLDKHSIDEAAQIVTGTSSEQHRAMCRNIRATLVEHYDPAEDARRVKEQL